MSKIKKNGCIAAYPADIKARALKLAREGTSTAEIARLTGAAHITVAGWRRKAGLSAACGAPPARFDAWSIVAGMEILGLDRDSSVLSLIIYRVRYLCCGEEGQATHKAILNRRRNNVRWCRECARIVNGKNYGTPRAVPSSDLSPIQAFAMSGAWR